MNTDDVRKNMSGALSQFADSLASVGQSGRSNANIDPPDFLNNLMGYFPMDKVAWAAGTYDPYLYDLHKTVMDNYEKGNYQVSYFYAHLIFMSFVYYCVERAYQLEENRMKDVYYPLTAYRTQDEDGKKHGKPDIENYNNVYEFSRIPEKDIVKVFRVMGMEDQRIKGLSGYISNRDDYAHATGKGNISEDALTQNVRTISKHMDSLHSVFLLPVKDSYVKFLIDNCEMEYSIFQESVNDFISESTFSVNDVKYLCGLGISGIRDENEEFKVKYRFIKKAHCAFIEYCIENLDVEVPDNYSTLRDTAYLYYKYQNNADDFVENELGISAYECGKHGGEFPVYKCLECGEDQLVFDAETGKAHCFACNTDYNNGELSFCEECGGLMQSNEISVCRNCIDRRMEE